LAIDGSVVETFVPPTVRALIACLTEEYTEWNNPFLPKFLEWSEDEWGNGGFEMGAECYLHLHVGGALGIEPVSQHAWCIPLSLGLKIVMRCSPNEDVKEGFEVMSIEMDRLGLVIVDKFESHEG
jgi:hypothetical protein